MNATLRKFPARWAATLAIAALAAGVLSAPLSAQSQSGPTIVAPSPADDAEQHSTPWSPPATTGRSTPSATSPAAIEELPRPADDQQPAPPGTDDWLLESFDETLDAPSWHQPTYWFGPSPWDTGVELGLNGSTGNNDSFSLRTGGYVKRNSKFSKLDLSLYHNRTATSGLTTQNNAKMDFRNDWLLDESSPWTLFAKGTVFYDQFQVYDLQTNANTGIGYQFVNEPDIDLTGRLGGGASREFGGLDDDWVPEALFGFEYEQRISATQKLSCKLDYHPEFEEFGRYRMVTDASWEIELDKPSNLSLKLSATDRYDSTPNGADPHLVNYSVLLLLKL